MRLVVLVLVGFFLGLLIGGGVGSKYRHYSQQKQQQGAAATAAQIENVQEEERTRLPDNNNNNNRVFCFVPIRNYTEEHALVRRIKQTWGQYCHELQFMAHISNARVDTIKLNYSMADNLWNMIHPAWSHVYDEFTKQQQPGHFHWFVKVDDDSYFSAPNLQALTRDWNATRDFYYLGHGLHGAYVDLRDVTGRFNLGGAYAISARALERVGPYLPDVAARENVIPEPKRCRRSKTWAEDLVFANCLRKIDGGVDVFPNNTRDRHMRNHFMLAGISHALKEVMRPGSETGEHGWEWKGVPPNIPTGIHSSASRPVSWHLGKHGKETLEFVHYMLMDVCVDPTTA